MQAVILKYGFHLGTCENIRNKYLNGRSWKEYYVIYYRSKFISSKNCFVNKDRQKIGLIKTYFETGQISIMNILYHERKICV